MSTKKEELPTDAKPTTVDTKSASVPLIEVTVKDKPQHRTPEQDAKDALAGRQAIEKEKADANQALMDAGKVVPLAPITAYEHERAKLGTPVDPETLEASESK